MKFKMACLMSLLMTNAFALEGKFKLDSGHAKVGFEVIHMMISPVEGKFTKFEGTLEGGKKLSDLKISVNIDVDSVNSENTDRDKHLLSPDFFDATKFPKMTFVSTSVSGTESNLKIKGKLTIKSTTKDVVIDAKISKEIKDPWGNQRLAISGKTKIGRKDFGLSFNKLAEFGPIVGDEVMINIASEAVKEK